MLKGNVTIRLKVEPFKGDVADTLQYFASNSSQSHSQAFVGLPKSQSGFNQLSVSTPTPLFTRVCIHEIDLTELKSVHALGRNAPSIKLVCGDWDGSTDVRYFLFELCFFLINFSLSSSLFQLQGQKPNG